MHFGARDVIYRKDPAVIGEHPFLIVHVCMGKMHYMCCCTTKPAGAERRTGGLFVEVPRTASSPFDKHTFIECRMLYESPHWAVKARRKMGEIEVAVFKKAFIALLKSGDVKAGHKKMLREAHKHLLPPDSGL